MLGRSCENVAGNSHVVNLAHARRVVTVVAEHL